MSGDNAAPAYAAIMVFAGMGIPIMAAASGAIGMRSGSPAAASAVMFAGALLCTLAVLAVTGAPSRPFFGAAPWPYYAAGLLVAAYALAITYVGPRFGLGNAVFCVLLGQIVAAAVIDQFGLLGAARTPIEWPRVIGIALMAVGIWFARKPVSG